MTGALPEGGRGQALALGLALILAGGLWVGAVRPLIGWHDQRAAALSARAAVARRMAAIAASEPHWRRAAARRGGAGPVLAGGSDAIAGAALQGTLQAMAKRLGTNLDSVATLPTRPIGRWRRFGVRISVRAALPVLVRLLLRIERARPPLLIGGLSLNALGVSRTGGGPPLEARITVLAFRSGTAR